MNDELFDELVASVKEGGEILNGRLPTPVRIYATLPSDLAAFLTEYQTAHALPSLSAALAEAVTALRANELAEAYRELGEAQRAGSEKYPANNLDGLA